MDFQELTGCLTYVWASLEWLIVVSHYQSSTQRMWSLLVHVSLFLYLLPCLFTDLHADTNQSRYCFP